MELNRQQMIEQVQNRLGNAAHNAQERKLPVDLDALAEFGFPEKWTSLFSRSVESSPHSIPPISAVLAEVIVADTDNLFPGIDPETGEPLPTPDVLAANIVRY